MSLVSRHGDQKPPPSHVGNDRACEPSPSKHLRIRGPGRDAAHIGGIGEGGTPTLDYSEHPMALTAGLRLGLKDEGRAHDGFGANPTQSFKVRGMAVVVAMPEDTPAPILGCRH